MKINYVTDSEVFEYKDTSLKIKLLNKKRKNVNRNRLKQVALPS